MGENNTPTLPTYEELFLKWPLYRKYTLNGEEAAQWYGDMRNGEVAFDAYCVECESHTPFKGTKPNHSPASWYDEPIADVYFSINLKCQRHGHRYTYIFDVSDQVIQKIGQLPSIEDIASSDIEKYRHILGKKYFSELHRAGGLASYGIGIGSFVYLRRIFERLIWQHKDEFDPDGTKLPDFATLRMEEKVEALRAALPAAVVRNKAAYSILSKGLHELSEQECSRYFPVVRAAIILMLEQDYLEAERVKHEADLEDEIQRAVNALKSPKAEKP